MHHPANLYVSRPLCSSERTDPPPCVGVRQVHSVTAVMARGKRPVPFRTRKLSLSAPMVLPGGPGGRVGHRRTSFPERGSQQQLCPRFCTSGRVGARTRPPELPLSAGGCLRRR